MAERAFAQLVTQPVAAPPTVICEPVDMVAGCHFTVRDGAYLGFIAIRDESTITEVVTLPAPRAESEWDNMATLRLRVRDALQDRGVPRIALWRYEGRPQGMRLSEARVVLRAEGVLLGAAGEIGIEVREVSPTSERKKGKHASNEALVAALVAPLGGSWPQDHRRAAAASALA